MLVPSIFWRRRKCSNLLSDLNLHDNGKRIRHTDITLARFQLRTVVFRRPRVCSGERSGLNFSVLFLGRSRRNLRASVLSLLLQYWALRSESSEKARKDNREVDAREH
jgi:hypothetical protein